MVVFSDALHFGAIHLSFFIVGGGLTYFWTSALGPCTGPVCQLRERSGIARCVWSVSE